MKKLVSLIVFSLFSCNKQKTSDDIMNDEFTYYSKIKHEEFRRDSIKLSNNLNKIGRLKESDLFRQQLIDEFNNEYYFYYDYPLNYDCAKYDIENMKDIILASMHKKLADDFRRKGDEVYDSVMNACFENEN